MSEKMGLDVGSEKSRAGSSVIVGIDGAVVVGG
jgi:hypothetical protein